MKTLKQTLFDVLWLGAVGASAWYFPKTTLVIVGLSAVATIALRMVEKSFE